MLWRCRTFIYRVKMPGLMLQEVRLSPRYITGTSLAEA